MVIGEAGELVVIVLIVVVNLAFLVWVQRWSGLT